MCGVKPFKKEHEETKTKVVMKFSSEAMGWNFGGYR